jgi:N-acetylmuramic acid 6-phosphate etherase
MLQSFLFRFRCIKKDFHFYPSRKKNNNMAFTKTTEQSSKYEHLEKMSVQELLSNINKEDKTVPLAVEKALPQIENLVTEIVSKMKLGGRLFYIGAGTSGRIGILDASECPPTFGVPFDLVIGIIAGGDTAIRKAVENAEDNATQAWIDLKAFNVNENDVVIGIAASGTTPYVIGGLQSCNENNITTGSISCNAGSPLSQTAKFPIEVIVGPEFVTGSSRMKAGTAQKLVLNMISTATMIQLGKVKGNKMVDMQLSNSKLVDRGVKMIMGEIPVSYEQAAELLKEHGSVRKAVDNYIGQ